MARDSFFTDFEVIEEHKFGPVTVLLVQDTSLTGNDPDWRWGYAIRTDFKTAVQDEVLKCEAHVISLPDGKSDDFYYNKALKLGDYPDDAVCSFSTSGDTEEEMGYLFDKAVEKFKSYGEKG